MRWGSRSLVWIFGVETGAISSQLRASYRAMWPELPELPELSGLYLVACNLMIFTVLIETRSYLTFRRKEPFPLPKPKNPHSQSVF